MSTQGEMKMKKITFITAIISLLALMALFTGCIRVDLAEKSGPLTSRTFDFTGFNGIEMGHAFELELTRAEACSINITAGENIMEHITVTVSGSTLKLGLEGWSHSWYSSPKVKITMPSLVYLDLSGASRGNVQGFRSSEDFELKLSGASTLYMDMETGFFTADISGTSTLNGVLTAADVDLDLSGASHVDFTGSGENIKVHASGASSVTLPDFSVNNADIEFTGASSGSINVSGRLDVDLSGASSLGYYGNPVMGNIDVSGASSLKRKD
jgi:hypothetical protein